MDATTAKLEYNNISIKNHFRKQAFFKFIKMILLSQQELSNGDVTSTLLLRKNGRASSPTIFSKNFAAGSVLSILLITDTVYFTLPIFSIAIYRYIYKLQLIII